MRGVTGWGRLATAVLLLLQLLSVHQVQARTKCLGLQEVSPKRYVSSGGATLPFRLGTSGRLTSRLVTSVFAIFLREVLGYPHVEVRSPSINNTSVFEALSSLNNEVSDEPKEFMVNLEVWIPPDLNTIHLMETYDIKECGLIAPPGRFGWFIPKNLFKAGENLDDWTLFKNPRRASVFSLSKENRQLIEESVRVQQHPSQPPNRTYYCQESYCQSGIYTPPWCKGQSCALLIAENTEDTEYVLEDIRKQKMYVEVAWLGEKLVKTAMELERRYREETRRALLYHVQMPSPITLRAEHVSVTFPPCDKYSNITPTFNCHYANIRLVKLAWSKLLFAARPAFEALQKMELSTNDYRDMVVDYLSRGTGGRRDEEELLEEVACDWLRSHNDSWYNNTTSWWLWRPNDDERNELYIGGIFPLSTNLTNSLTAPGIVKGSMMAIHAVNSNDQILRDYKLNLLLDDGKCQPDEVLRIFIDYIRMNRYSKLVGILGPACSDTVEPLAGVSKHFKTMVVSYSAEGSSFSREKYPYFFRTIGENKQYKYVYLKLLQQLQWTRVASLTEDGTKYTEYISHTQDLLQSKGIAFVANRKFPQDWEKEAMKQYLEELKAKNARIIIADVNDKAARALMCEAYHMDMTAYTGWVWFLPHWLSSNWFEVSSDTLSKEKVHCTTQEMKMAINGHFALSHSYFAPDGDMMQENITVGEWRKKYRSESKLNKVDESNYAGYAYDAVWVYAYALDHLMKMNESYLSSIHDENTTKIYVNLIQNINFHGVSGHIQFSSGSSRFTNVNIMQVVDGRLNLIGTYLPNRTSANYGYANGTLNLNESLIRWLNPEGVKPWDGKPEEEICVLQGLAGMLNSNCQTAIIVANCIGISFLIIIVAIAFFIVKHRYDQKAEITKRFLEHYNIDLLSTTTQDKWEIPKDRIVINRKLGEGAFGFVYGGEAYFAEKGWVAVAVKTLKVGSSVDEKLDFLSEAEVMKRFDHKNIVQLLGVCTKAEPVYTVMEFMLYGDLKTFLLARRHLVYEKSREESDEVSSKRLTNMALDVARALSYLAEVKYVHRDVASRNCLVNVNKVVKLGDFGMTRPMCDNDYYRFQRKGMLPVRWMAPESLLLGVFSPHSDVWSYGVLLYEIVTFGSFPFQGYSNLQVLEHVKAGNTLDIPKDIKNNLGELIRSCWNPDPKKRPPASEIVEYLANNPKLISPCLDVPLSSVQMEDTGEISGEIIGNGDCTRRFSIGLRQRSLSHEINEPLLPSPTRFTLTRGGLGEDPQDSLL